jgi:hypothetical protein
MTAKEEALRVYTKFTVYRWHEVDGWVTDESQTLKLSIKSIEESANYVYNVDTHNDIEAYQSRQSILRHLQNVVHELKKI